MPYVREYQSESKSMYQIALSYQSKETYKIIEEKELYPWEQMMSEIGGFLGVVIGASIISVFEIIDYLTLVVMNKYF